jgi:hypothetical protein
MGVLTVEELIIGADDLHSNFPIIELLNNYNCNFILNCTEGNHKTLYEFVNFVKLNTNTCFTQVPGFKELK